MRTDAYKSIRGPAAAEMKVRGSRFIGEAIPVRDEEEAALRIDEVKRREHAATHHCTAYRLGPEGDVFRYNDDGEPGGTAGPPILRQIESRDLTDILVVVTRYFGGTQLGTGGLARAYGEAAEQALEAADVVTHVIFTRLYVSFQYDDTSPAMYTIEQYGGQVVASTYSEKTELTLDVPSSRVDAFEEAFVDALGGRGEIGRGV
ncbi:MAG: YigZ family protein [Rhodothermales bacterium]